MENQAEWDLISRDSVLKMLEEKRTGLLKSRHPETAVILYETWREVLDMPPAAIPPEIKREVVESGEWESGDYFNGEYYEFECVCSLCGSDGSLDYVFCPCCGARMKNADA